MRILVSGGCGFVGAHVVARLHKRHHQVYVFDDLSTGKLENVQGLLSTDRNGIDFELCDVRNEKHLLCSFEQFKPEIVVHLAAQSAISTSLDDPVKDAQINALGMLNVIHAAKWFQAKRIIFASTSAVYREKPRKLREYDECQPVSPYGVSKLAAELYLKNMFPHTVILRFGNVYGPLQVPLGENRVIPRMIRHFKYGDEFQIFGDGKQTRDWVFVEDVAEAVEKAITGVTGTYNIASGTRTTVNQLAEMMAEIYGVKGYQWEHAVKWEPRRDITLDVSAAERWLDWKARTKFMDGLKRTKDWWDGKQ